MNIHNLPSTSIWLFDRVTVESRLISSITMSKIEKETTKQKEHRIKVVREVSRVQLQTHPHPNLLSPFLHRFPFQRVTR